jgi:hypothetical protein
MSSILIRSVEFTHIKPDSNLTTAAASQNGLSYFPSTTFQVKSSMVDAVNGRVPTHMAYSTTPSDHLVAVSELVG